MGPKGIRSLPDERFWADNAEVTIQSDAWSWEWIFQQSTGDFGLGQVQDVNNEYFVAVAYVLERGYSGRGVHLNRPDAQQLVGQGPIPRGTWIIQKARYHDRLGPVSIPLAPLDGRDTFGRSGFYIHGDNRRGDKSASSGCIILSRAMRDMIVSVHASSPTRRLMVVA